MSRLIWILIFTLCLRHTSWAAPANLSFNFDELKQGPMPKGWLSGYFNVIGNPKWEVEHDSFAPSSGMVLKQSGRATYSWLVKESPQIANGIVETEFKILSGKEDPEAGLVWRHLDGKNYYFVRANAVENNVVLYRMNGGKKEVIKIADIATPFGTWHKLKVRFQETLVEVFLDQKNVITVNDTTINGPGRVGFFTTADTVCAFDNFSLSGN